jgi:hypothetical protein
MWDDRAVAGFKAGKYKLPLGHLKVAATKAKSDPPQKAGPTCAIIWFWVGRRRRG